MAPVRDPPFSGKGDPSVIDPALMESQELPAGCVLEVLLRQGDAKIICERWKVDAQQVQAAEWFRDERYWPDFVHCTNRRSGRAADRILEFLEWLKTHEHERRQVIEYVKLLKTRKGWAGRDDKRRARRSADSAASIDEHPVLTPTTDVLRSSPAWSPFRRWLKSRFPLLYYSYVRGLSYDAIADERHLSYSQVRTGLKKEEGEIRVNIVEFYDELIARNIELPDFFARELHLPAWREWNQWLKDNFPLTYRWQILTWEKPTRSKAQEALAKEFGTTIGDLLVRLCANKAEIKKRRPDVVAKLKMAGYDIPVALCC